MEKNQKIVEAEDVFDLLTGLCFFVRRERNKDCVISKAYHSKRIILMLSVSDVLCVDNGVPFIVIQ